MPTAYKHSKRHHDPSNRPTGFTVGTKTDFYITNGGHLEKWAGFFRKLRLAAKLNDMYCSLRQKHDHKSISDVIKYDHVTHFLSLIL